MAKLVRFVQTNASALALFCLLGALLWLALRQGTNQQQARAQGICLKAQARTGLFTGTAYTIYLRYKYQGQSYHNTLLSATAITSDSVWIKVLPANPDAITWGAPLK
jgi:hypothetical protein